MLLLGGGHYIAAVAQYFVAQIYVATAWHPPYDASRNYISDLGNTACAMFAVPHGPPEYVCSPLHAVMNGAFGVSGVLLVVGTAALGRFWPIGNTTRTALGLLMISGCGKILVGWMPENENLVVHSIGALNIPIASLAILLISLSSWPERRPLALIGFASFFLGVLGTTLSIVAQFAGSGFVPGWGVGGIERLASYPANAWLVATGLVAIGNAARSRDAAGSFGCGSLRGRIVVHPIAASGIRPIEK